MDMNQSREFSRLLQNVVNKQIFQISQSVLSAKPQKVTIDEFALKFSKKLYYQEVEQQQEQESRMQAVRYEIPRPVGVSQLKKVNSPQKYPYNCIFAFSDKQQNYVRGTGFLIGPNLVITAAHSIYSTARESLQYEVKTLKNKRNVSRYRVSRYYNNPELSQSNSFDYALVQLQSPIQRQKYLDLSLDCRKNQQLHVCGYPCSRRGEYQMANAHGIITGLEKQSIRYSISTVEGMSGSPLVSSINRFQVIGIHCGTIKNGWNDTEKQGFRWSNKKINQLNIFMRELGIQAELKIVPQQLQKSGRKLYRVYQTKNQKQNKKEQLIQFHQAVKYYKEMKEFHRVVQYYEKIEELLANKPQELAVFINEKANYYYEFGYIEQSLKYYLQAQDILIKVHTDQSVKLSIIRETIDRVKSRISEGQLMTTFPSNKYLRTFGAEEINFQKAKMSKTIKKRLD